METLESGKIPGEVSLNATVILGSSHGHSWVVDSTDLWPVLVKLFLYVLKAKWLSAAFRHRRLWMSWAVLTHRMWDFSNVVSVIFVRLRNLSDMSIELVPLQKLRCCILCHTLLVISNFLWVSYLVTRPSHAYHSN